jgi:hypothetical protein
VPLRVTRNPDVRSSRAAELVERGLLLRREGRAARHHKALQRFEAAAQVAPPFAFAHAGVARAWMRLVGHYLAPPQAGVTVAIAAVRRALRLQPVHAESLCWRRRSRTVWNSTGRPRACGSNGPCALRPLQPACTRRTRGR